MTYSLVFIVGFIFGVGIFLGLGTYLEAKQKQEEDQREAKGLSPEPKECCQRFHDHNFKWRIQGMEEHVNGFRADIGYLKNKVDFLEGQRDEIADTLIKAEKQIESINPAMAERRWMDYHK